MDNEIIKNEEAIEVVEAIEKGGMSRGFKIAIGVGLTAVVGYAAYRFVVKPTIAKIKANKKPAESVEYEAEIDVMDCQESA